MELLRTLSKAWKYKELRQRIIFTLLMLVVFRIGSNIPVPGIDRDYLSTMFSSDTGLFDLFDLFSGGSFSNFTIFALSITPYVTASIIIQLLTIAIPYFERLSSEGESGRRKMATITRYLTVCLALVQAIGLTVGLFKSAVLDDSAFSIIVIILTLTAGTAFLMWLGEKINEYGIGNGISLLIFAGIVSRIPTTVRSIYVQATSGSVTTAAVIALIVAIILITMAIIAVQQGTRKIPVQYAKRVVGRKMYGGQSSHLPMKVNQAGVIPIIFSVSLLQFPVTLTYFWPNSSFAEFVSKYISTSGNPGVYIYAVINIVLTLGFTYFYTAIMFKTEDIADNMRQSGGFVPGIRPGKATIDYLNKIRSRLCFAGGIFLATVATIPTLVSAFTSFSISFGGTSLLIIVGVALDTVQRIETEMLNRNYEGFLR